jgi:hypothetical protein
VEKVICVLQFEQNHSATLVQQWFRTDYGKEAPMRKSHLQVAQIILLKLVAFVLRRKIWADDQGRDCGA